MHSSGHGGDTRARGDGDVRRWLRSMRCARGWEERSMSADCGRWNNPLDGSRLDTGLAERRTLGRDGRSVGWPTTLVRRPRHDADASRRFRAQAPLLDAQKEKGGDARRPRLDEDEPSCEEMARKGERERRGWYRRCMGTRLLAAGKIAIGRSGGYFQRSRRPFPFFLFARTVTAPARTLTFFV